jgi:hypothetical protein
MSPRPERRAFARLDARLPVSFRQLAPAQWSSSHTLDVGAAGLRVMAEAPLLLGTPLAVEVRVRQQIIEFVGEVVWRRSVPGAPGSRYELGVKILKIAPAHRLALMRLVEAAQDRSP